MAAAAVPAAAGAATSRAQRRGLEAVDKVRTHAERRRVSMSLCNSNHGNGPGPGRSSGHYGSGLDDPAGLIHIGA